MAVDIMNMQKDPRFFVLGIGKSGCGKSAAFHSFPKQLLEFDIDLRIGGVKNCIEQGWLNGSGISVEQFSPTDKGAWGKVEKVCFDLDIARSTGRFPYKTISVGSLFSLARLIVNFSHQFQSGRVIGEKVTSNNVVQAGLNGIRLSGPADFNVETTGVHQFFDHLRTYPANILVSAHTMDRWGKPEPAPGASQAQIDAAAFAQNEVIGEKLTVRDQLGENVQTYFDNVWRFTRDLQGVNMKWFVEFQGQIAKNTLGIPAGKHDITKKEFYPFLLELIEKYKPAVLKP